MNRTLRLVVSSLIVAGLLMMSGAAFVVWRLQPPTMSSPARADWTIRNVTLVEAGREPRPGRTIRVENGVVVEIGDRAIRGDSGPFADDLAGLYVTPGLTDLHVHYPPGVVIGNAQLWSLLLLSHGVTSIRETGSVDGSIFVVREAIRSGEYPGPRIFACGVMLDGERPSFPSNRVVATAMEAEAAVEDMARQGADCIKAYNMLEPEALEGITRTAARFGLPVIGHAPHSVSFEESGIVDLQHGTGAVIVDRERVGRSDFLAADWTTMDDARIDYVARASRDRDIAHTPTLVNARMRRLLSNERAADVAMNEDSGLRHLPRFWAGAWSAIWGAPFVPGDEQGEARHEYFRARQAAMTRGLHAAGVRIHAGTDTLMPFVAPGSSLLGELDELGSAGIDPEDVWAIATSEAGHSLGLAGLGRLEVGAPADLLFLRANPAEGLDAFGEIEAVLADGRLYRRADFEDMLSRSDVHFRGDFYSGLMGFAMGIVRNAFAPEHDDMQNFTTGG